VSASLKTKGSKAPPTLTVLQSKTQHSVPNSNKTSNALNKFKVLPTEGRSSYAAVVALEQQHAGIQLNAKPNPRGYYILTPRNQEAFQTLQNKATELNMQELNPLEKTHPKTPTSKEGTKVHLFQGKPPTIFNLGIWGDFQSRPYIPEPLRCFHCQRFGHRKSICKAAATCAICSGKHETQLCKEKLQAKQKVASKCKNC